jgi:hypothetical protein
MCWGEAQAAAPRPSFFQKSWQLDFLFHPLTAVRVPLPGEAEPRTYWYLRYEVSNHTGEDRAYQPEVVMYTEHGEVMAANWQAPHRVFLKIKQIHNDPLLRTSGGMTGKLLQGDDNAKRGVAIWPDFDARSGFVDIFIGGLSGETVEVTLPKPIPKKLVLPDGEKTILKTKAYVSKTLHLRFRIAAEPGSRHLVEPVLIMSEWVMR